jgi:O-antigen/teichoic acid export membrane protein
MWRKVKSFLLHNTSTRQTVAKNTFWLSVSNFGGRLIRAGLVIYAARVLGAHGWGIFNYAITLMAFFGLFSDVGINSILTREASKESGGMKRLELLSTSFAIKLALIVLTVTLILFAIPHFSRSAEVIAILPIASLIFIFDTLRDFGFSITRSMEKMEWEASLFLVTNTAILIAGIISLRIFPTVSSFAWAYAIGTGVGSLATMIVLWQELKNIFRYFSRKLIRPIFTSAWPFAISGILGTLMINTDVILIGLFKSAEDVGYYSAANKTIQIIYLLPMIAAISLLPTLSRLAGQEKGRMREVLEKVMGLSFILAMPLSIGGILLGKPIIALLFGQAYVNATLSFQILCLTLLVDFSVVILTNVIFVYDQQKSLIIYAALGGFANVALDLFLIPKFGIAGSAWATFIAQCISNSYLWYRVKSIVDFRIFYRLKVIIPASLGMGIVAFLLNLIATPVLLTITAAGLFYALLLYLLKEPFLKDLKLFTSRAAGDTGTYPTIPPASII